MITGFDLHLRTRLIFGLDVVDRLGALAAELGQRVLVVTDAGIAAAGHLERARRSLLGAGLDVTVFDRVRENPTGLDVNACVEVARDFRPDLFVGLGGGSAIDAAKGCNFVLTNGGRIQDYWGTGKAARPMLPLIAVPTTAGTGSECQSFALIADEETHQKMACGDVKAAPRIALLDPTLTLSQPRAVTASTGIDALAHALETAVTRRRTELSALFSREAFVLIMGHLSGVLTDPDDLEARARMQLGAAYAGIAIENSMLGAVHSAANPLTAQFGIVHGQAVGIMLPHVLRFNAAEPAAAETYRALAAAAELTPDTGVDSLIAEVLRLLDLAGVTGVLERSGVTPEAVPTLAADAAGQWTARFNPRPVSGEDFSALYRTVLSGSPKPTVEGVAN